MLTQTERSSTRMLVLALAIIVVGMAGLAVRSTSADSTPPASSAALAIGGVTYQFSPTACTVTATDFLAAGPGQMDGQDFWVSVSPETAEIAFGTADERQRSDDDADLWLRNDGPIEWTVDGTTVDAVLMMVNERLPDLGTQRGHFSADCS